ncbi:MAG: glucose-1-phosphate thymidylyltransferase RfbA [candidate division Zixibacteria bacterium]|jgi:glucose-1-phosphate thymidylyltransferase|nr:glucose-1-phosphate thymidylyltransferase RfbA [candidate division Zixibacteria bacterium]
MTRAVTRGIILAGGSGTRLYPATSVACKQLLPVYDKPLIYYPMATLMQFGIREMMIISTPEDTPRFEHLFGDGSHLGLSLRYAVQERPQGIAQAFLVAEDFCQDAPVALVLGDNIFYGIEHLSSTVASFDGGALIFAYKVHDPSRYGVVTFDNDGLPVSIVEKPTESKSPYAVTGLYIYDADVVSLARSLKPSRRGELEISELNGLYLQAGRLRVERLGRGIAWLDTGTFESLLEAGNFIATIERRQGQKIACLEEIAFRCGFIDRRRMQSLIERLAPTSYRAYLEGVVRDADEGRS